MSALKRTAEIASTAPETPYVSRIMLRRPHVSKKWPRTSGPTRFPIANGKK
jgi:hypothetical protein